MTDAQLAQALGEWLLAQQRELIASRIPDVVTPPPSVFLSVKEAAVYLAVGETEIKRLVRVGELASVKHGDRRLVLRASVEAWAEALIAAQTQPLKRPVLRAMGGSRA